jgi:hypothetical protein
MKDKRKRAAKNYQEYKKKVFAANKREKQGNESHHSKRYFCQQSNFSGE